MPRFAKKGTTKQDILEKMIEFIKKDECFDPDDFDETDREQVIEKYLYYMAYSDSKTRDDLDKIDFDFENCGEIEKFNDANLVQHSKLSDGTAIIWCFAGGDWEYPINFVIYLDDKNKLRGYIPSDGNIYCHKCKCAYGTCECDEAESDRILDEQPDPDYAKMYADVCNRIQTK